MSEKLKIKISIANRVYPLTILPNQEQGLRIAAQKIEKTVKKFEQNYSVQDKQDVLAMCALQFAAQSEQSSMNNNSVSQEIEQRLVDLDDRISGYLDD
ncbi:MAG: cell division protein ZapA [Flavobacteriaceae bacterium]|jgi:cell division protein ZapA|tara:strand:+ start:577 stop:870 length:294 start_codon:yes stop_codon:yes gene_type:complete